jgi:Rieske Fe-S protein
MKYAQSPIPMSKTTPETAPDIERRRFARLLLGGAVAAYTVPFVVAVWDFLTAPAFRRKIPSPLVLGTKEELFARQNYAVMKFGDKNAIVLQTQALQTQALQTQALQTQALQTQALQTQALQTQALRIEPHQTTGARAFDLRCTHAGCTVEWQPAERKFVCHCHGGEFAEDGSVTRLPPTQPLEELRLTLEGGKLVLHDRAAPAASSTLPAY